MKRDKQLSNPRIIAPVRTLTAEQIGRVKGGATAIEYGLVMIQPSTPLIAE